MWDEFRVKNFRKNQKSLYLQGKIIRQWQKFSLFFVFYLSNQKSASITVSRKRAILEILVAPKKEETPNVVVVGDQKKEEINQQNLRFPRLLW